MSDAPKPEKRKRSRVVRTSHALPNAAEHAKASSRLAGATARYAGRSTPEPHEPRIEPDAVAPELAPADEESPATSKRPQQTRRAQPKAAAWRASAAVEAGAPARPDVCPSN